uniref:Glycosyl hydrolase family 13 catalytic domain-containing protein n=1 Tax=Rhodosorus marinus TaxID=101924 RepID=A0A7S0BM75_9RHOD|mmetsp:Transcript_2082/g.3097  ORF Transcript_2082/g.3097 Transcript_2082/m.3097 type:complete len:499 (+) Transcript_2082:50-1546(+)
MSRIGKGFTLYEINSRPWLFELREKYGTEVIRTIADVPDAEIEKLKEFRVHMVWLQGVWKLGKFGLEMDKTEPGRVGAYGRVLPGFTEDDIIGSPYAVVEYVVNEDIGGDQALQEFRKKLSDRGIKLMLDLVPNHMAVDSEWMKDEEKKEYFVRKPSSGSDFNPHEFMADGTAHGKDPYCGAWPDTAQLNYFNPELRKAMTEVLVKLAASCDGLRVDMAMLILNKCHNQCWGPVLAANGWSTPQDEFWRNAIKAMRQTHPDMILMAEVYWGLDSELIELGFDATYDKALYDTTLSRHLDNLRGYIGSKSEAFLAHSTHFVENHDEPRAVAEFGGKMNANCAAALQFALPGIRLQFHGQWAGVSKTLDVHLRRHADEPRDEKNEKYYKRLNAILDDELFRQGSFEMVGAYDAGEGDRQVWRLTTFKWTLGARKCIAVFNYSDEESGGHITLDDITATDKEYKIQELLGGNEYSRNPQELKTKGLFVWLKPFGMQFFQYT